MKHVQYTDLLSNDSKSELNHKYSTVLIYGDKWIMVDSDVSLIWFRC